jgi:hypothetical protein
MGSPGNRVSAGAAHRHVGGVRAMDQKTNVEYDEHALVRRIEPALRTTTFFIVVVGLASVVFMISPPF